MCIILYSVSDTVLIVVPIPLLRFKQTRNNYEVFFKERFDDISTGWHWFT